MKSRAKVLLATCFVAGVALTFWLATPAEEPSYHGKTLSYWLGGDDPLKDPHGLYSETEEREARVAIRTMGKRCIPELLRMVAAHSWLLEFELRRKPARLQEWYLKSKLRDDLDKFKSGRGLHALQNLRKYGAQTRTLAFWSACSPLPLWLGPVCPDDALNYTPT